eukprot:6428290-Alexandrium_andersonii.AAC.1
MPEGHKYADPEVQRKARSISGPFPSQEEGGRWSETPQVFYKGVGWEQLGLILSEMRCRDSNPAEGGRALNKANGDPDIAVYCFADVRKSYAWSSYTRGIRLMSHNTYWCVVIEAVSCANCVRSNHKRPGGKNRQLTIPQEDFHITAILIKGFHPVEGSEESKYWWGTWIPEYMDWKYWTWPGLRVADVQGYAADPRRHGWPAELVTRVHAELAAGQLDCHY